MELAALAAAIAVNLSFLAAGRKGDAQAPVHSDREKALYIVEGEYEIRFGDQKVRQSGFVCFRSGELPRTLTPLSTWPSRVPGDASDSLGGFWNEVSGLSQPLDIDEVLSIAERYRLEIQTF